MKRTISEGGVYHSIQSSRVAEGSKTLCEREGETGDFLCLEDWSRGLRHKFTASSALGRHRNKRLGRDLPVPKLRDS